MFFSREQHGEQTCVLFTIGTARIIGVVATLAPGRAPRIHYTCIEPVPLRETLDADELIKAMTASYLSCAMDVQGKGLMAAQDALGRECRPERFAISLMPPWYRGGVHLLTASRDKPITITPRIIDTLIDEELTGVIAQTKEADDSLGDDTELLEQTILRTKLNGYTTERAMGLEAQHIELSVYLSFMSGALKEQFAGVLEELFRPDDIRFLTAQAGTYLGARDLFRGAENALIIDLSGEMTALSIIEDGVLLDAGTAPIGTNHLIRSTAKRSGATLDEAASYVSLALDGALEESSPTARRTREALGAIKTIWIDSVRSVLTSLTDGAPLPRTIFLACENAWIAWGADALESRPFGDLSFTDKPFSVIPLDREHLKPYVSLDNNVRFTASAALALLHLAKVDNREST